MRIISGMYGGRNLPAVLPSGVRPTLDAARETVFNMLQRIDDWSHIQALDLYAGSGALGIEALSRGAAHLHFVESNAKVIRCVEQNLHSLSVPAERYRVVHQDALSFIQHTHERFNLVFVDPPYAARSINAVLFALHERSVLHPGALLVVEHGPSEHVLAHAAYEHLRTKNFGETVIEFYAYKEVGHDTAKARSAHE